MNKKIGLYIAFSLCFWVLKAQNSLYFSSPQEMYDNGYQFYINKKFNSAIAVFENYIKKYPKENTEDAAFFIASSKLRLFHSNGVDALLEYIKENPNHNMVSNANFELGNYFYGKNQYEKSIRYFEEVEDENLTNEQKSELNFKLAYSYFSNKNFKVAGQLFERARLRNNKYQSASAYYAGYIHLEESNWQKAYDVLITLENDKSYSNVVPIMIIKALYNLNKNDETIEYGKNILKKESNLKEQELIALYLGSAYFNKKDYKNAIENLKQYDKANNSADREVNFRLGYSNYTQKEYNDAVNYLKKSMIPDDSLTQVGAYYLGASLLEVKNQKLAVSAFKQASDLEFDKKITEEALYNYGKISYEIGDYSNSIISFSNMLSKFPESKYENEIKELLSESYLKSDNYEDALKYLEAIRTKNDYIKEAYQYAAFMLAVKSYNCGDFEQTELYLDKSFVYPVNEEVKASCYYLKGEMLSQKGESNLAILAYSGVFQSDTKRSSKYYLQARYGIAYQYYNHKEYQRARGHFQYFVENPTQEKNKYYYDAKVRLADCYYIDKEYTDAAKYYEQVAAETNYMNEYVLFQSGVLNYLTKNAEKSKSFYRQLVQKYPTSVYADNSLYQTAIVDFENANYVQAVEDFKTLINRYPNSELIPFALEKKGIANSNLKNNKEAKQDFAKIINEYSSHETAKNAIFSLQEVLIKLGESSEFDAYLTKYKNANPEDNSIENVEYENARNLFISNKFDKSIEALAKFLKNYPSSSLAADAKYYLAESYYELKNNTKAIEVYEEVIAENKSYYVSKAINSCADVYFSQELYAKSNDKYAQLVEFSTKNNDKVKGYLGQMNCAYAMKSMQGTILFAQKIINNTSAKQKDVNFAYLMKGKSELQLKNDTVALQNFRFVVSNSKFELGAEANYLIAKYLYDNKKYTESINSLHKLNENYASFDYWLGKSFLLIADNYISMNELFQAKATLKSIIDHSVTQEIILIAKEKLMLLEQDGVISNIDTTNQQSISDTLNNSQNEE